MASFYQKFKLSSAELAVQEVVGGEIPFLITVFADVLARKKQECWVTLSSLQRSHYEIVASEKSLLPLIKLAKFGDQRTKNGSLRSDNNLLTITGIEGDYDDGNVSIEEACKRLDAAGINGLILPTPSHTSDFPRWRVICPISAERTVELRDTFSAHLNNALGGILARESFTKSQAFYFGSVV
jgi:hypothetical protein